jgi:phage I-like protein
MPYANEHAARQADPGKFTRFRRMHPDGFPEGIDAIMGFGEGGGGGEIQALRAAADKWTPEKFSAWLKEHDFSATIEKASGEGDADESESLLLDVLGAGGRVPPTEFRLFRVGPNPTSHGELLFDAQAGAEVLLSFAEHGMDRLPIDYDHKSLRADAPVDAGRAAGWFVPELRGGELWAGSVKWTPAADRALRDGEWRYISPVVRIDGERRVRRLVNIALTNLPAIQGLEPLVAASQTTTTEITMSEKLCKALGAEDEAQGLVILAEHEKWTKGVLGSLGVAKLSDAEQRIAKLVAQEAEAVKLAQRVAELEAEKEHAAKDAKIAELSKAGKAPPATHDFLRTLTLAQLDEFAKVAPTTNTAPAAPAASEQTVTLSDDERKAARSFGMTEDAYKAAKAELAKTPASKPAKKTEN